jgi:beta-glucosidase
VKHTLIEKGYIMTEREIAFPSEFSFGVADADLQVIGEDHCIREEGSQRTMWAAFASAGRTHRSEGPGVGIDRFSRWREDADLMTELGFRHYRTSVSMSRLLHRDGSVNGKAVEWYRRYWTLLRERGVRLYVTLYHWELPEWLDIEGGWTNRHAVDFLLKHGSAAHECLGDLVDEYFTINEPWCASLLSYHLGIHAPGRTSLAEALNAAHNLLLASGLLVRELKSCDPDVRVGVVLNSEFKFAVDASEANRRARTTSDCYFNRWFYDPIFKGSYPEEMREVYRDAWPRCSDEEMQIIKVGNLIHALGVNNYAAEIVTLDSGSELGYRSAACADVPRNDLGWPIALPPHFPVGLYDVLMQIYHSYRDYGLKRMYITENGMALEPRFDSIGNLLPDERRIQYYRGHLEQVHKAICAGLPVEKYFAWTFMDNYEWSEGYRPESCFGLVHVDRTTLARTPNASCRWYSDLARSP